MHPWSIKLMLFVTSQQLNLHKQARWKGDIWHVEDSSLCHLILAVMTNLVLKLSREGMPIISLTLRVPVTRLVIIHIASECFTQVCNKTRKREQCGCIFSSWSRLFLDILVPSPDVHWCHWWAPHDSLWISVTPLLVRSVFNHDPYQSLLISLYDSQCHAGWGWIPETPSFGASVSHGLGHNHRLYIKRDDTATLLQVVKK